MSKKVANAQPPTKTASPYVRIMAAARKGKGLRLSAQEVRYLSFDDAIATVATNETEGTTP